MAHHEKPRGVRGQALLETAIGIVLLLLVSFSVADAALLFFAYLTLQNGVTEATRYSVTGQQADNPDTPASKLSREESLKLVMRAATPGLTIDDGEFSFYDVTQNATGTGGPKDVIRVTVTHPWQLASPVLWPLVGNGGVVNLRVSATMKNEPYPTS
jgi:TadE-like protein